MKLNVFLSTQIEFDNGVTDDMPTRLSTKRTLEGVHQFGGHVSPHCPCARDRPLRRFRDVGGSMECVERDERHRTPDACVVGGAQGNLEHGRYWLVVTKHNLGMAGVVCGGNTKAIHTHIEHTVTPCWEASLGTCVKGIRAWVIPEQTGAVGEHTHTGVRTRTRRASTQWKPHACFDGTHKRSCQDVDERHCVGSL